MKTNRNTPEFQREASELVQEHAILNVSPVIQALIDSGSIDEDTTYELSGAQDWQGAFDDWRYDFEPKLEPQDQTAQELCEENEIEPYEVEVLEHWHVTDWLARQLQIEDEKVVLLEDLNLLVWCRTTSGQALSIDHCIEAITERVLNER